jgi:hypothetical protein
MSILPIVQQDLEEKLQDEEVIIESETEEQSEEEQEPIIEVKQRKKAVRNEIFDVKDDPEPVEPEPEHVKQKPQKRRPAKFYEEGYREGDFRIMIDKNGSKRWVNDKTLELARARMTQMHKDGIAKAPSSRKKKPPSVEVQLKQVLEKQEESKNNLSEEFIKKYQEDLMNIVKTASFNAVEEYDTKRKARKAEKKAQQKAELVQSQMRSKLEGIKQPVKYGSPGYFDTCWD